MKPGPREQIAQDMLDKAQRGNRSSLTRREAEELSDNVDNARQQDRRDRH